MKALLWVLLILTILPALMVFGFLGTVTALFARLVNL